MTDQLRKYATAAAFHAYTLPRSDSTNSRLKDLVDMVLLVQMETLDRGVRYVSRASSLPGRRSLIISFRRDNYPACHWISKPESNGMDIIKIISFGPLRSIGSKKYVCPGSHDPVIQCFRFSIFYYTLPIKMLSSNE